MKPEREEVLRLKIKDCFIANHTGFMGKFLGYDIDSEKLREVLNMLLTEIIRTESGAAK
jgi:hypothetical protein